MEAMNVSKRPAARRRILALPLVLAVGCATAQAGSDAREIAATRAHAEAATTVAAPDRAAARARKIRTPARTSLERAFHDAAERIRPSVVSIATVRRIDPRAMGRMMPFGLPFGMPDGPLEQRGLGSGVILDAKGHILTNNHVVQGADELEVHFADDRVLTAEIVGTDPKTDLAVIRVEGDGLVPASFGDAERLEVGQWVLAVGSPFGLEQTVSAGIVSAVGRGSVGIVDYGDFIQTDAAINPGNSGGPLVDLAGNVVGINTAIASRGGGSNGIGFAIPAHIATSIADRLIADGHIVRGWLGVFIAPLDADLAETFGLSAKQGVLIQDVLDDGPAAKSDLRAGDVVVELDGEPVRDPAKFRRDVADRPPGTKVRLTVVREGRRVPVTVELGTLPEEPDAAHAARPRPRKGRRKQTVESQGLVLRDLPAALRSKLGTDGNVIVEKVEPGSRAARAGIRPRDVLLSVGGTKVRDARHAQALLDHAPKNKPVRVRIERGRQRMFLALPRK